MKVPHRCSSTFSLVEVTLAISVAAISMLTIFALLPLGVRTNQRSIEQTASADLFSMVVADLRATPLTSPRGNAAISPLFHIPIPPAGTSGAPLAFFFNSAGQPSGSLQADSRYRVTVTFPSNGGSLRSATFADIKVTWPAAAENADGSAEIFVALDRN